MNPAHEKEAEEYAEKADLWRLRINETPTGRSVTAKEDYLAALQGPSVTKLVEAHERTVKAIGGFIDSITVEAAGQPDLITGRRAMIETLQAFKRSSQALAEFKGEINP